MNRYRKKNRQRRINRQKDIERGKIDKQLRERYIKEKKRNRKR